MMSKRMPPQTAAEKARNNTLRQLHCILCTLSGDFRKRPLEIHHIVRGNKRLGHWYTLQLCVGHHQGKWTDQAIRVGIKSGRRAFREQYGYDELELWQRQQIALGLDDALPATKVLPRRLHGMAEKNKSPLALVAGPVVVAVPHDRGPAGDAAAGGES
jgi:Recombination enhancement, RecA-dependent nuclease